MEKPYRQWLADKSWSHGVRYCKVVACLLPPAALATDIPLWHERAAGLPWLVGWQIAAEAVCLLMILTARLLPANAPRELPLNLFCAAFVLLSTWIGIVDWWMRGDLSIYAAGLTFAAAVLCTPMRLHRPLYALSLLALAVPVWDRMDDVPELIAALVNPFCVVVLCIELDRLAHARNRELYDEKQRAELEHARADKVLYNALPAQIADELKRDGKVNAVKHDNMGVLFADIVGFTHFSSAMPPDALVLVLDQVFSRFDLLVERAGVEKIKTIGDAYMVVSHEGVDALGELALAMGQALALYNRANGTALHIRIGIHAGPAVAGVIGVKRFLYDVWGDTVNVASRLEASSEPGQIHVSEPVFEQLQGRFSFLSRERVEIKGRGPMPTWWLLGRVAG